MTRSIQLTVESMPEPNGPGLTIDTDQRAYFLWAPRKAEPNVIDGVDFGKKERGWAAGWESLTNTSGDYLAGSSSDVVTVFPDDLEGREARNAMLDAVKDVEW